MTAGDIGKIVRESGRKTEEVLRTVVVEEVMARLAASKFGRSLWLASYVPKGGNVQKRVSYYYRKDEKVRRADGFVPGQDLSAPGFVPAFLSYIKVLLAPDFRLEEKSIAAHRGILYAEFSVFLEAMHTPLVLYFVENDEDLAPEKIVFTPRFGGKTVDVLTYPFENICAADCAILLGRLSFVNDLEPFAELYGIISQNACDGTSFQVRLRSACLKNNISFTSSRLEKFRGLRDNAAFAKKWDKRRKKAPDADIPWGTVIDTLFAFVEPVWKACMEGTVFFGDWMPELGRYLDG